MATSIEPLVSIITVVFNAAKDLPELIESVARHRADTLEFIVIDGGSTDGTPDLLRRSDSMIDYWVSEPDGGIYDAMNKGIAAAHGTFLFHLNAGDRLLHLPLEELAVAKEKLIDVLAGRVSIDDRQEFRPNKTVLLRFKNTLHHQGTFYRRDRFPAYETSYRVFADFDANQKLARSGVRITILDQVIASHMSGGLSDTQTAATVSEFFTVIRKNYGWTHLLPAWLICKGRGVKLRFGSLRRRLLPTKTN